jgi:hypothetical protein
MGDNNIDILCNRVLGYVEDSCAYANSREGDTSMSRARAQVRVYRSVDELPEILEPGKYVVEGAELEVHEPTSKRVIAKMLRLLRERPGHRFI